MDVFRAPLQGHRYLQRQSQYILEEVSPEEIEDLNNQPMQVHRQFEWFDGGNHSPSPW